MGTPTIDHEGSVGVIRGRTDGACFHQGGNLFDVFEKYMGKHDGSLELVVAETGRKSRTPAKTPAKTPVKSPE